MIEQYYRLYYSLLRQISREFLSNAFRLQCRLSEFTNTVRPRYHFDNYFASRSLSYAILATWLLNGFDSPYNARAFL